MVGVMLSWVKRKIATKIDEKIQPEKIFQQRCKTSKIFI